MPFDDRQPGVLADHAQYRHVGVALERLAQPRFVARPADAIEHHPGDPQARLERLVAQHQRREAACGAWRIEHQHDRQLEPAGQRGVAVAAVDRHAVVQAEVALDQAGVGGGGVRRRNDSSSSSQPLRCGSRLRQARPAASVGHIGSM